MVRRGGAWNGVGGRGEENWNSEGEGMEEMDAEWKGCERQMMDSGGVECKRRKKSKWGEW